MTLLYLMIAVVVGYLIGNINFARIFSLAFAKKDITTVGSKNPGTMNMLRTRGLGEALLTLLFEALKSGLPALSAYFLFETFFTGVGNVAFFLVAISVIVGHCFPVFYHFKGGKGVACTFGMFLFHPQFWWVTLVVFVICFLLFFFIQYPFILSFLFAITLSTYATVMFSIQNADYLVLTLFLIWINFVLLVFMHRGNIARLFAGQENKVDLKEKLRKKKKEQAKDENVEQRAAE